MKLLFITRKYPPSVGGMENLSFHLAKEFKKTPGFKLISWGGSQKWLPVFLVYAFFKSSWLILTRQVDRVHLGDAVLSPLGIYTSKILRTKTTVTACGLDITYKMDIYQWLIPKCVARLDKVICISKATLNECTKRGIPVNKCVFIPCGVEPDAYKLKATKKALEKIAGLNIKNKKVLITVGRLVKRKGVNWFVQNIMPNLKDNYIYLIAGAGPEEEEIKNSIRSLKLSDQIKLLGKVSDLDLKVLYNTADVFVMPNIPVEGDMEGFGIVAIEASSVGLPVVASNLEGIADAVLDGKTGYLVINNSKDYWEKNIQRAELLDRLSISKLVINKFGWRTISTSYFNTFRNV